jgi:WD40 repeat protein
MTSKAATRRVGGHHIAFATLVIVLLGWAGIGVEPAWLNIDAFQLFAKADANAPRLLRMFAHDGEIGAIAWSPDGEKIAAGGQLHRALIIWDARSGARLHTLDKEDGSITSVRWSGDGRYLAAGRRFTAATRSHVAINVWDAQTGRRVHGFLGPDPSRPEANDVRSGALAFSPDSTLLAAGHLGAVSIHEVVTGRRLPIARSHVSIGKVVAFSADSRLVLTSGPAPGPVIQVFDAMSGSPVRSFGGGDQSPFALAVRPDGLEIASANFQHPEISVWDTRSGRIVRTLTGHTWPIRALEYSRDGRFLASAAPGGGVMVWDARTGSRLASLPNPSEYVDCVAFSPDARYLAAPFERTVRVWDISILHSRHE